MTSPDPVPAPPGPVAEIVTTEGTTWSATEVTGQALRVDEDAEVSELTLEPDDCVSPNDEAANNAPDDQRSPERRPYQPAAWASRMPGLTHNGSLSGPLNAQWPPLVLLVDYQVAQRGAGRFLVINTDHGEEQLIGDTHRQQQVDVDTSVGELAEGCRARAGQVL